MKNVVRTTVHVLPLEDFERPKPPKDYRFQAFVFWLLLDAAGLLLIYWLS